MNSKFVKWGLALAVLLALLWWLVSWWGSHNRPAPVSNSSADIQPVIPPPLSNVPQGVLSPPSQETITETAETTSETASVMFSPPPKPGAPPSSLSPEERKEIHTVLATQPALADSLKKFLKINPKQAAAGAAHYNRLSPAEKHQIGLCLKARPDLAGRLVSLLALDGRRAAVEAAVFNKAAASARSPAVLAIGKKRRGGLDHEMEWWGYRCGVKTAQTIIIRNDDAWDKFRKDFPMPPGWTPEKDALDPRLRRPPPDLPDVNFDRMMVIGVFLGRVQEGYRIAISTETVSADGKTMNVNFGATPPLPNPMSGSAYNEPYDILVIKRFAGDVYFWNKP